MTPQEWWQQQRELSRWGYDPYNSFDAFNIWQRFHARPE